MSAVLLYSVISCELPNKDSIIVTFKISVYHKSKPLSEDGLQTPARMKLMIVYRLMRSCPVRFYYFMPLIDRKPLE